MYKFQVKKADDHENNSLSIVSAKCSRLLTL